VTDFSKIRVLLDSHDLALPQGTGIRTYGRSLIAVLRQLGTEPSLLVSAHFSGDPLVARALLADVPLHPVHGYSAIKEWLRHALGHPVATRRVSSQAEFPLPHVGDVFPFGLGCEVSPFLYEYSHYGMEGFSRLKNFKTAQKYDLWHATLPLSVRPVGMRQVTTIHDLIPLLQPHTCPANRGVFAATIRAALAHSQALAVVSEHTKKDLLDHFDFPHEKIVVTHQPSPLEGWSPLERVRRGVLREFGLQPQKYLLFVGNIEPKKNLGRLIRAYLTLDCDLPLIIVGRKAWMWQEELAPLRGGQFDERVRLLDYVSAEWLPYLYESAYALAFPSLYEGFGLPPLEAMTVGCPVLCSRVSSLPEVMGDAAEYVDPHDLESIATGLERLLGDRAHRDDLAARGRERAKLFSREKFANRLRFLYDTALG
jgi:glycosyltransferase involved in cell wall biosynthesis